MNDDTPLTNKMGCRNLFISMDMEMKMRFGIEIECGIPYDFMKDQIISPSNRTLGILDYRIRKWVTRYPSWEVTTDGSLSFYDDPRVRIGREFVSTILDSEEDGFQKIREFCAALKENGVVVNDTCGLHVHVDASHFDIDLYKTIMYRYAEHGVEIDKFMKVSRITNCYCRQNDTSNTNYGATRIENISDDRYLKVNPLAYGKHGTIEFRQHYGTIDAEEIINWVKFLIQFIEQCQKYGNRFVPIGFNPRNRGPLNRTVGFLRQVHNEIRVNPEITEKEFYSKYEYSSHMKKTFRDIFSYIGMGEMKNFSNLVRYLSEFGTWKINDKIFNIDINGYRRYTVTSDFVKTDSLFSGIDEGVAVYFTNRQAA